MSNEDRQLTQLLLDWLLLEQKIYKYEFVGDTLYIWPIKHASHISMSCEIKRDSANCSILEKDTYRDAKH